MREVSGHFDIIRSNLTLPAAENGLPAVVKMETSIHKTEHASFDFKMPLEGSKSNSRPFQHHLTQKVKATAKSSLQPTTALKISNLQSRLWMVSKYFQKALCQVSGRTNNVWHYINPQNNKIKPHGGEKHRCHHLTNKAHVQRVTSITFDSTLTLWSQIRPPCGEAPRDHDFQIRANGSS